MSLICKNIMVPYEQVVGFRCDRCGLICGSDEGNSDDAADCNCVDYAELQEIFHWKITGGYGSIWGDGTTVEVVMCQHCTKELFKDFAKITGYI